MDTDADAKDAGANSAAVTMPTDAASVMIPPRKFMPILSFCVRVTGVNTIKPDYVRLSASVLSQAAFCACA